MPRLPALLAVAALLTAVPAFAGDRLEAVVTTRVVHPGQVLEAGDLRVVAVVNPRPVRAPVARSLADAVGRVARRTLLPRRYIALSALRLPHAVEAGRPVRLRYRRGAMLIETEGTALASAARGEAVRVRVRGGRNVSGTALGAGTVEVRP